MAVLFDLALIAMLPVALLAAPVVYQRVVRQGVNGFLIKSGLNILGQCDNAASLLKQRFIKEGINGRHIRIETGFTGKGNVGGAANIWDEGTQQLISTNKYHEGIVVKLGNKDFVFDNIYTEGKEYQKWLDDLAVPPHPENMTGKPIIVQDNPF
jgi:hypothetical protein